jgi:hypothetical protein
MRKRKVSIKRQEKCRDGRKLKGEKMKFRIKKRREIDGERGDVDKERR